MRILKSFIIFIVFIILLLGSGFLIAREFWLSLAAAQVKQAAKILKTISRDPTDYYYRCREKGGLEKEAYPETYQLNFLSDTQYRLEVICKQFPSDPIIIKNYELPRLVKKVSGSSGLVWSDEYSGVGLELLGRKTLIAIEGDQVKGVGFKSEFGLSPRSSCEGFGFTCCQLDSQTGEGRQLTQATNCPKTCFENCRSRPAILSFTTSPIFDLKTRVLQVENGESVTFNYLIDEGAEQFSLGKIDFGDGQSETFTQKVGSMIHDYRCLKASCTYEAKISAMDVQGVDSAETAVGKLTIIVVK